jgi:dienelactone hydrolase
VIVRRLAACAAAAAGTAALLVGGTVPASASVDGVTTASSELSLRCNWLQSTTVDVDWYEPPASPSALALLVHGQFEDAAQMRDLALAFADAGYLVAVPDLPTVSWACGLTHATPHAALAQAVADGRLTAGAGLDQPPRVVLAGHGVGASVASAVAAQPSLRPQVALVVHLAGSDTDGGLLHAALQRDASTPVLQLVAGNDDSEHPSADVVGTFRTAGSFSTGVDGAVVVGATRCDPLGGFPLNPCGSSPHRQRAFFDLAVAGANEATGGPGENLDEALDRLAGTVLRTPHLT